MIVTRALNLGLSFANLGFKYFSKIQLNLKNQRFLYNFSSFLLRYILWCLIKSFINNNSAFFRLNFQFSVQTSRQTSKLDHHTRPSIPSQIRTPNRNTTSYHRQSDHQIRPQDQITPPDHRPPSSKQNSIPNPLKWYRSGAFFMGWVKGGIQSSG